MKRWMLLSATCLAFHAEAEIYKCKDAEGKIIYQEMPCKTLMLGKIQEAPKVSEEDRKRAQENLDRMLEMSRKRDIEREQAWQKEQARRLAEEEQARQQAERERLARLEQENRERNFWYPWLPRIPWFNQNRPKTGQTPGPHHDPHEGGHQRHNSP